MAKLVYKTFTSSGSWTAPAGVTQVWVLACGGGGGGNGGRNTTSATNYGGLGAVPYFQRCTVVPNTSYTVTIGGGGAGGAPRTTSATNGSPGGNTTFGSLATFAGAPNGVAGSSIPTANLIPGLCVETRDQTGISVTNSNSPFFTNAATYGTSSGSYTGGRRGAAGYNGSGGNGGNGNSAGTGANGGNSSAIGGGGGGGGSGSVAGGSGGNGGDGMLTVIWVE